MPETAAAYAERQRQQAVAALRKKAARLGLPVITPGELARAAPAAP